MQNSEQKMKLAGEVWHEWCLNVYRNRPKNHYINSPAGEDVFKVCFEFMKSKFRWLLAGKYSTALKLPDEFEIPNILINPNDWVYRNDFWSNIFIFLKYRLSKDEIIDAMAATSGEFQNSKFVKAYIQIRQGLKNLRKLHEQEAKK